MHWNLAADADEKARKMNAYDIPGLATRPVTISEFEEAQVTFGAGRLVSRLVLNTYVRVGSALPFVVVVCSTQACVGLEQKVFLK